MKALIDKDLWEALRRCPASLLFDVFYRATLPHTFAVCSDALHDPEAAEEAVQCTYARLWEALVTQAAGLTERAQASEVTSWLLLPPHLVLERIATLEVDRMRKRYVRNIQRQVSLDLALEVEDPRPCVRQCLDETQRDARLQQAIARLPAGLSQPLILYYEQRCSHEEIGQLLNLDRTTVSRRIMQSVVILKAHLAKQDA